MNRKLTLLSSILLGLFVTHAAVAAPKSKRGKKAESAESADTEDEGGKAGKKDAKAKDAAEGAMQDDYLGTDFKKAEKKLKKAIKTCGDDGCSPEVQGQLHRDLAVVYIAGMKNKKKGNAQMKLAVEANPDLELDSEFTTPEVEKAFVDAGGKMPEPEEPEEEEIEEEEESEGEEESEEPKCDPETDEDCEEEPSEEEGEEEEAADDGAGKKNWLSLAFQQDFLFFSSETQICDPEVDNQWACFSGDALYDGDPPYNESGNRVAGGLGVATRRILVGYDRAFGDNLTLGARVGFAFSGAPADFLPLHLEARGSYWFTSATEPQGFHPYVTLALGVAQVSGRVSVEYFTEAPTEDSVPGVLDAWRNTGNIFLSGGLGGRFGFTPSGLGLFAELRLMQMLGASATGMSGAFGLQMGL